MDATNLPEDIDAAILRTGWNDTVLYYTPSDIFARQEMQRLYQGNGPVLDDIDLTTLAELMDRHVSSDISFLFSVTSRLARKDRLRNSNSQFAAVLKQHQPSTSRTQVRSYEKLRCKGTFKSEDWG